MKKLWTRIKGRELRLDVTIAVGWFIMGWWFNEALTTIGLSYTEVLLREIPIVLAFLMICVALYKKNKKEAQ